MADFNSTITNISDYIARENALVDSLSGLEFDGTAALEQIHKTIPNTTEVYSKSGEVIQLHISDTFAEDVSNIGSVPDSTTVPPTNNPASTTKMTGAVNLANAATTGKLQFSGGIGLKASTGTTVSGIVSTASWTMGAISAGILLGKSIDKLLYETQPDWLKIEDWESFNPETWDRITMGITEEDPLYVRLGANAINWLFGFDQQTGTLTPYMDEQAVAYYAWVMNQKGVFNGGFTPEYPIERVTYGDLYPVKARFNNLAEIVEYYRSIIKWENELVDPYDVINNAHSYIMSHFSDIHVNWYNIRECTPEIIDELISKQHCYLDIGYDKTRNALSRVGIYFLSVPTPLTDGMAYLDNYTIYNSFSIVDKYTNTTVYYLHYDCRFDGVEITYDRGSNMWMGNDEFYDGGLKLREGYNGVGLTHGINRFVGKPGTTIPGISDQPGIALPPMPPEITLDEMPQHLREVLPDVYSNAITQIVPQPDGTEVEHTYIPVPQPDAWSLGEPFPVSGTQNQSSVGINPSLSPESVIQAVIDALNQPSTNTDVNNNSETGKGQSPIIIPPIGGTSNALWAVYNPSQSEVNAFGAWLWSSDLVEQIKKLFSDPMQSIIGLHKVFAPPSTGGKQTIKVGYISSDVSANVVTSQYTTVDCGNVDIREYFGNVLDYTATAIHIYLPFIGIVPLNVADVMRSTVNVKYHVDVLTGACLVDVSVIRDGYSNVLYTYSGQCSVNYPLSSGSYMGIVSALASIAGGAVATVSSGGAMLPFAMGAAASALSSARTRVEHSGGFSGASGAMGCKKPYIIITRAISALADNFGQFVGVPSNKTVRLASCKGYTRVLECHVDNIDCTDSEKTEIESMLKNGIILH